MADGTLKVGTITTSSGSGTITLGQSGETITIPSGATQTGVGGVNTPAFEAKKTSGTQAIANNADTKVTFNAENFDTDSAFASDKFTVPSGKGGKYFLYSSIGWTPNTNNVRVVYLYKNGSEAKRLCSFEGQADAATFWSNGGILDLSAGDYIEVYCYQNSGGSLDLLTNGEITYFGGYKIIE
tara:strand:+ start:208 stop:756 length:549 start_codon:yes stop_codon:yes gene_type:complete